MKVVLRLVFLVTLLAGFLAGGASLAQVPDFSLVGYATMTTGTTGGAGGRTITVTTGTEMQAALNAKKKETEPLTIYVAGKITPANSPGLSKIDVKELRDVSILGVGTSGEFDGIGIKIYKAGNIIIRNVKVHHVRIGDKDCISIEGPADHIWIDHCELYNEFQGVGKDYYDALLDAKAQSEYITFSWNYFHDSWKASLAGSSESDTYDRKITFHHNYFRNLNSRLPLFRGGNGHVFNNYYKDVVETAINSRIGACLKIENNYFLNVNNPYVSAYSKVVGYGDISGNILVNSPFKYSADEKELGACTSTTPYSYSHVLHTAEEVPAIVEQYSGVGKISFDGVTPPAGTFQLNTLVLGQGSVTPSAGTYTEGASVALTATPAVGWQFSGWSGDAIGTVNPVTVVMNSAKTVSATFTQSTSGGGDTGGGSTGTVRITALDAATSGLCEFNGVLRQTNNGTSVMNLSNSAGNGVNWKVEVPVAGQYNLQWRYAGGGSSALETAKLMINGVLVDENASFPKPKDSNTFATTATMPVTLGAGVNLIRIEVKGTFADIEWIEIAGDGVKATDCANPVGYTSEDVTMFTLTSISTPEEGGSVVFEPRRNDFAEGTVVTITAVPEDGYVFTGWGGDAEGTELTTTVTMTAAKEVVANFEESPETYYQLAVTTTGQGSVTPAEGTFESGETVTLLAVPAAGWSFAGWSGDASGSLNPLVISMDADKAITATFTEGGSTGTTVRLEDASAATSGYCSVDGAFETEHAGADNGGYLNTVNAVGTGINWKVQVPADGVYTLKWRFANATGDRSGKVLVNDETVLPDVAFPETGAWITWAVSSEVPVALVAGVNTIRLEATTANGLANIDWVEITGESPVAAACGSVVASFQLSTSVTGQGSMTPAAGNYNAGETVTLTATPATGWTFIGWSGDATGTTNPLVITMNADKSVTAIFSDGALPEVDYSMRGYATVSGTSNPTTTGGAGGAVITIRTLAELEAWAASREKKTIPEIVHISGRISSPASMIVTIKNGANISILGIGSTAQLENVGLNIRQYNNVIVRNLKIHEVKYPNDALTIDECEHVWIDHNEFHSKIGPGIGVDTYDGLLDIKKGSRFVTVSWNHFHDHMKNVLIGHTDNAGSEAQDREIRVTFHHNLFENTDGRNPSLRWGAVHMFNNYLRNITDYGIAVRQGAHALLENNVYENVKLPIATNKFTGEGYACERGNIFIGTSGANNITQTGCDWWTPVTLPYEYTLDPVGSVATIVPAHVGVGKVNVTGVDEQTFQLTTSVVGQGAVSPANGSFDEGASVTLTATAAEGYLFSGWSGDATGTTNPLTIVMNNNKTLTATFVLDDGGAPSPTVRILADATLGTGLCSFNGVIRVPSTTNGGPVLNLDNTAGRGVNWKVEVPAPGTYQLKWRYAGGGSSATESAKLLINGSMVVENVAFPRPNNSTSYLTTESVSVSLGNGVNEIRLEVYGTFADIEWIEVTGEAPKMADCAAAIGSGGGTPTSIGQEVSLEGVQHVYPNPFTGSATFEVSLKKREHVKITLFTINGAEVDVIANGYYNAGSTNIVYENKSLRQGLYFYVVETGGQVQRGKLLVK